ncbi:SRPBCC family protein [Actinoallomurus rhizosphaericola]|uniref:SRPBCC family protein n=1 Tax=Actinoallomurus rhizosphaericola TaxID=2952536 RepID=UPI002092ADAF|nr:SRPBCC family protein [Actinoallomurus rhizosphaericola]MCO5995130.1 SRPBCC family protein [Actinoallomurus rhizosphaericola]
MNPTLETADGRSVLRFERRLAHPVEKVWRALTDPAHLAHWFPSAVEEIDLRLGGEVRFTQEYEEIPLGSGEIAELDPPHVLAFTWYEDPLRWELRPDGEGCLLVFTHTFTDRPMAGSFATGWEACLSALGSALAGAPTRPAPEDYPERHDAYAEAFGLDEGVVVEDADGWTIRFERNIPHPIEQVWPALAGPTPAAAGDVPPPGATVGPVPAGEVTEAAAPEVLEYSWPAGDALGRVRWRLTGGHPAGTRVVLTCTGPAAERGRCAAALAAWHLRLRSLADRLRDAERPGSDETGELERRYAARIEAR